MVGLCAAVHMHGCCWTLLQAGSPRPSCLRADGTFAMLELPPFALIKVCSSILQVGYDLSFQQSSRTGASHARRYGRSSTLNSL